jgi:hypothetical protein
MPTTFVHGLLPTSCVSVSYHALPKLTSREWGKLILTTFVLGNLPDLDLLPAFVHPPLWHHVHRYVGHNIFSLALGIFFGQWIIRHYVSMKFSRRQAWILAVSLVLSHVLLDAMCQGDDVPISGVPLLWPFTRHLFAFPWGIFPAVKFDHSMHPMAGLVVSRHYWGHAIFTEIGYSIFFLTLWSAFWGSARLIYKLRRPKPIQPTADVTATTTSYPSRLS